MQLWKEMCLELTEFLARYLLSDYIVVSKKVLFFIFWSTSSVKFVSSAISLQCKYMQVSCVY